MRPGTTSWLASQRRLWHLHSDLACYYGLLGHAFLRVDVQSLLMVLMLPGWWLSHTLRMWAQRRSRQKSLEVLY